jgi:Tfp pilus assembly protein PilF
VNLTHGNQSYLCHIAHKLTWLPWVYQEAVRAHHSGGRLREEANALTGLADAYLFVGDPDNALDSLQQALEITRRGGYQQANLSSIAERLIANQTP